MDVVDAAALSLAERLEQSVGPRAAFSTFRPLVQRVAKGEARTRAILGALRCAVKLDDVAEVTVLAGLWALAGGADRWGEVLALCLSLSRKRLPSQAAELAVAEAQRTSRARAHYLAGR